MGASLTGDSDDGDAAIPEEEGKFNDGADVPNSVSAVGTGPFITPVLDEVFDRAIEHRRLFMAYRLLDHLTGFVGNRARYSVEGTHWYRNPTE